MFDTLEHFKPGSWQLSPDMLNMLVDAVKASITGGDLVADGTGRYHRSKTPSLNIPAQAFLPLIWVVNTTSTDFNQFDPVGLGNKGYNGDDMLPPMFYDATQNKTAFLAYNGGPRFPCSVPDLDYHKNKFAVLLEPVSSGGTGAAMICGAVPVRVYVNSYDDKFCDIDYEQNIQNASWVESTYLTSGSSSQQIIWWEAVDESYNGKIVWAVIRLGASDSMPIKRVRLVQDLYSCSEADAVVLTKSTNSGLGSGSDSDNDPVCHEGESVRVADTIDVVGVQFPDGYAPAGACAYVYQFGDSQKLEVISFGNGTCCGSVSGYSGGPSGSSGASSGGSLGASSGASSGGLSESGSGKSSAIVPAKWSPGGYTALFVDESPDVRFNDVLIATIVESDNLVPIDPRFIAVCEANSLEVCGCVPDVPVLIGAIVEGDYVRVRMPAPQTTRVVLRLTGIRRGFHDLRFPDRTAEQFESNERFIKSAYAHE